MTSVQSEKTGTETRFGITIVDREDHDRQPLHFSSIAGQASPAAFKALVIRMAQKTITGYDSQKWIYACTPKGEEFMYPAMGHDCEVHTIMGYGMSQLPQELAGLTATALAILGVLETPGDSTQEMTDEEHDRWLEAYHRLMDEGRDIAKRAGCLQPFFDVTK
jgi:hypothetical protein